METSPLICRANQWTRFYMIGTFVIKELRNALLLFKNVQRYLLLYSNSLEKKCMFFKNVYMLFENNCLSNESIFFKAAKSKYSLKKFLRTLHQNPFLKNLRKCIKMLQLFPSTYERLNVFGTSETTIYSRRACNWIGRVNLKEVSLPICFRRHWKANLYR